MNRFVKLFGTTVAVSLLSATFAFADYAEAPVSGGGSVSGKITFKGTPPPPEKFDLAKFPQAKFCSSVDSEGMTRLRHDVKVKGGALADVVVYITNIEKGKPFKPEATKVVADQCRFLVEGGASKSVGVVVKKGEISFTNNDADPSEEKSKEGVLHNPHGYEIVGPKSSTTFNKPLPKKGQTITEKIKPINFKRDGSFLKVECDQHNYMNVWFRPIENPYYAIVGEDGTFTIGDVPPGKYKIEAFHPKLGFVEKEVEVAGGGKATADFEFAGK
ncbi:MAG: hypothetical protein MCM46_13730 [Candidatus Manganitrophus sp. SB1]|nr:hypothetical protein [Candidatus Manganitrophus morganii]